MDPDVSTTRGTPLEVPVFTYHDARSVVALGGKRIELNALGSYPQGGLTPSIDQLMSCGREVPYTIRIMIRPRGPPAEGPDFIYTDDEFQQMYDAIADFKATDHMYVIRGDGFVFGILKYEDTPTGEKLVVDVERCKILADLARPFTCIFHRAFDLIAESEDPNDIHDGFEDLQRAGMHGVLTSGGPGNYLDHIDLLSDIVRGYAGKLDIIIGGGVRSSNIAAAKDILTIENTRVWMHSSCITGSEPVVDNKELTLLASELGLYSVD